MKSRDLLVRCMGWHEDGQWVALCLDFDLAAQDDTWEGARQRLNAQIGTYVRDALVGADRDHASHFLVRRRAPLRYWLKFYWLVLRDHLNGLRGQTHSYCSSLPLQPA